MAQSSGKGSLKGKDLITIGIFSAIYFVINFIFMLMGGLHPMMWILMPGFIALLTGIPFMLMCSKVQKMGAVILMGTITGLIYFVTGMFTVVILVTFAASCILGEAVRSLSGYSTFKGNLLAFICFSLGMTGSPLPIWLMHDKFISQISEQGMPAEYITTLEKLSSPAMLLVLFLAPVIGAIAGSLISKKMFQKHFIKAGIV
ncbi:MptD family putative ECF transporter S component [Anaerocolumna xylanovorans]|uniref:Energy-coupling factor transport system substrate-specific component n=1 Tax=Anaerocolumna xylanovorans DSM 12503 TaxID=1121345 RepID=A0A1M7YM28_9FIRM|nr:MptD family putative ECF transporter S component [Anaerocolumna xylanovorans]SHO53657.1 energy-coupling factor transport system substrate-specific component [Anaerocolumna xylanovorans DSM 12503]